MSADDPTRFEDRAVPVDDLRGLDLDALRRWLQERLGPDAAPLAVERFPRGYSNLTWLLRAGPHELVLRRPPVGVQIAQAHDMAREYRVLEAVGRVWGKVPRVVALCEDPAVLGAPFYLMERVHGVILRDRLPRGMALDPAQARTLSERAVDTLVEIHCLQPPDLELGHPEGYVQRQVAGWTRRYERARTDALPDVERLAAWLDAHRPPERGAALIHNDFKYDNLVLDAADPTRIRAVLDWEMATRGDPLLDLGSSLAYWVQADDPPALQLLRLVPTDLPGTLTRTQLVQRYVQQSGRPDFDPLWYYAYGLFKLLVVAQQLYARWVQGLTKEARYEHAIWAVRGLSATALEAIRLGRIEDLGTPGA